MFDDKDIFITGGTGSFGKCFIKTILERYTPRRIVVYSRDEFKQFEMQQSGEFDFSGMRYFIGDVRDPDRLRRAMEGIDYVVHAAALKQVPALEYNPIEAVRTNILGAEHVIQAAKANGVKKVIALSTDKAANPVNLYGATKLASDKLFVAANNVVGKNPIEYAVVRYGNVVNSRGSVIPFFQKKIAEGKALPITDPRMTRFWITLPQGVEFVLKNFERMQGGEIFIPKIPSINIMDLAKALAPYAETEIVGIRPGEKLHEIMVPSETAHQTCEFHDHYVITPAFRMNRPDLDYSVNGLGEESKDVEDEFEYNSGTNPDFLNAEQLKELIAA